MNYSELSHFDAGMAVLLDFYVSTIRFELVRSDMERSIYRQSAFMTRYGRIPPSESLTYPRRFRDGLMNALADLIREENKSSPLGQGFRET